MKKILLIAFLFCVACRSTPVTEEIHVEPQTTESTCKVESILVRDKTGKVIEIPVRELEKLNQIAKKYIALKDHVRSSEFEKQIRIETIPNSGNSGYKIYIPLNDEITIVTTVHASSEELSKLREQMKLYRTQTPTVSKEKLSNDKYRITMQVDDLIWQTDIQVDNLKDKFNSTSFWMGYGAFPLSIAIIYTIIKTAGGIVPFLLL